MTIKKFFEGVKDNEPPRRREDTVGRHRRADLSIGPNRLSDGVLLASRSAQVYSISPRGHDGGRAAVQKKSRRMLARSSSFLRASESNCRWWIGQAVDNSVSSRR